MEFLFVCFVFRGVNDRFLLGFVFRDFYFPTDLVVPFLLTALKLMYVKAELADDWCIGDTGILLSGIFTGMFFNKLIQPLLNL